MVGQVETFEGFCQHMFLRNCDEREGFGEPLYTYEEYIKSANDFLKSKFKERSSGR